MKSLLKAFLKISISLVALYYVYTKIDIQVVFEIFKKLNYPSLFVALLLFVGSKLVSAIRLNYYFNVVNAKLESYSNLRLYLLGMYYNLFLPGGIGGDGYKVWILNKNFNLKVKDLFWGVFLDRLNGVFALFLLSLLMVPLLSLSADIKLLSIISIPLSLIIYLIVNKKFFKTFYTVFIPTTLLSLAVQILQLLSALFILWSNGSADQVAAYLFLFLISSIVAALPITIGGVGSREITFLFGARLLNLDINLSIALSLIFYIITLVVSLAGIYYSLNTKSLNLQLEEKSISQINTP